jgi:hypothetical protein
MEGERRFTTTGGWTSALLCRELGGAQPSYGRLVDECRSPPEGQDLGAPTWATLAYVSDG